MVRVYNASLKYKVFPMVSQNLIVRFWITVNARNRAQNPLFCLLFFVYICSSWYNLIYTQHYSIFLFNCRLISYFFCFAYPNTYLWIDYNTIHASPNSGISFTHTERWKQIFLILKLTTTTLVNISLMADQSNWVQCTYI